MDISPLSSDASAIQAPKPPVAAITWVLRLGVFGEFLGHGIFAIQGKAQWVDWIEQLLGVGQTTAGFILTIVGIFDVIIAFIILLKPVRLALLWATFWGFWTAILRPIVGEPVWDFIERWANWSAPLALLLIIGWPKSFKEWLK